MRLRKGSIVRRPPLRGLAFGSGARIFGGMTAGVDRLELLDADLGVDGGGFKFFVTKQLLNVADIRAAFEQVRCAGVPEQMRATLAADVGLLDVQNDLAPERVGIERLAIAGQEQLNLGLGEEKK